MFGNELFFFISGFGLALGVARRRTPFAPWIARRFTRVFVPLFVATTLIWALGFFKVHTLGQALLLYTGVQHFWFLPAIFLFYFPLYAVLTAARPRLVTALALGAAVAAYALAYMTVVDRASWSLEAGIISKVPFYFVVMLSGTLAARECPQVRPRWWDVAGLLGMSALYVAFMFAMRRWHFYSFQFGVHLIGLAWLVFAYRCSRFAVLERLSAGATGRAIAFLSGTSLQIYLIQEYLIRGTFIADMSFPANVAAFGLLVLPAAWLLEKLDPLKLKLPARQPA